MAGVLQRFREFPAPARAFLAGAALLEVAHAFQLALQNLYVLSVARHSVADAGHVNSASACGVVAATIPAAWFYERLGPRRSLSLSCALNVLAVAGLALSSHLVPLLLWSALSGAAYTLHVVVAAPFLVSVALPRERTALLHADFAIATVMATGGQLLSCLLAGALETGTSSTAALRIALLVGAGLSLLALFAYRRVPEHTVAGSDELRRAPRAFLAILHREHWPLWVPLSVPHFLIGVGAGFSIPFINLYFTSRFGLGKPALGLVLAAASATMAFGALFSTRSVPRLGLVRATILTQALSLPFFLMLALAASLPVAILAFVLRSALMNLGTPLWRTLVMEITPIEWRASVNAAAVLAWNVGWAVSNLWAGVLIDHSAGWLGGGLDGYALPMLLTIALYVVAIALEARVFWGHREIGRAPAAPPTAAPQEPPAPEVLAAEPPDEDAALRA
jgi:MFS family permease